MLDSEITFKIKVRLRWTVSKFCLRQQLCAFKEFCMETRLSNIFKTTNVTDLTKVIQQNSYSVLQVTCKWKTLKQPVYFLKVVEYFGKSYKTTLFRRPAEVSQNTSTFIPIGLPITK